MIRILTTALMMLSFYASAQDFTVYGSAPIKPNPEYTTGDFCSPDDPDFIEYRYPEKVPTCARDVSRHRKAQIYDLYRIPEHCRKYYTVDHYIPLFMGGSNQPENLWPEHRDVKATRQNLEQNLYDQMRTGQISQDRALHTITYAKQHPPHVMPRGCK